MKLYQDRDWLKEQYWDLGKNSIEIAGIASAGQTTILRWMEKFGIDRRDPVRHNSILISDELHRIIDGALLGDWHIGQTSALSAELSSSGKYEQFMLWFAKIVSSHGLEMSKIRKQICDIPNHGKYDSYRCYSKSYPELLPIRNRWYPDGKKIVPKDLTITPTTMLHLYIGDGCLDCRPEGRPRIILNTQCFTNSDRDRLVEMFFSIGIEAKNMETSKTIYINTKNTPKFLDYIGGCPKPIESVYGYKFSLSRRSTIEEWRKKNNLYPHQ